MKFWITCNFKGELRDKMETWIEDAKNMEKALNQADEKAERTISVKKYDEYTIVQIIDISSLA